MDWVGVGVVMVDDEDGAFLPGRDVGWVTKSVTAEFLLIARIDELMLRSKTK